MEKNIWVLNCNKNELIDEQQSLNESGALRTICLLSHEALIKAINRQKDNTFSSYRPSLILLDYGTEKAEEFKSLNLLQSKSEYAGIPILFMVDVRNSEIDEECYERGATIVLKKPLNRASVLRIERSAWQYEKTRNYEKVLQIQSSEIETAKKINKLNKQLESRNELLHQVLGRYFSDEVVDVILENPNGATVGGEKQELTVMMADIRGFTAVSENLPAEVVTDMINNFLEKMTEIVFRFKGSVIEFIGDAVLAVFGAPIMTGHPTEDAIAAAINMQNKMKEVNKYNIERGYPSIEMGIGINSGETFIGNIGSEKMMRYNIIGKSVNLCSRIENFSVGGQILVSMDTLQNIANKVMIEKTFYIMVKGISKKVQVGIISGIYAVHEYAIQSDNEDELINTDFDENLIFMLSVIEEKKVSEKIHIGVPGKISKKCVELCVDVNEGLELFDDVEVSVINKDGKKMFSGIYGKIISKEKNDIIIRYTSVQQDFNEYYSQFL